MWGGRIPGLSPPHKELHVSVTHGVTDTAHLWPQPPAVDVGGEVAGRRADVWRGQCRAEGKASPEADPEGSDVARALREGEQPVDGCGGVRVIICNRLDRLPVVCVGDGVGRGGGPHRNS